MPMIMDDVAAYIEGMDEMDDLFLDPVQSAALPAALMPARSPATRGLLQKLDELGHAVLVSEKLAWSKFGAIATIKDSAGSAQSIEIHNFIVSPDTNQHYLTPASLLDISSCHNISAPTDLLHHHSIARDHPIRNHIMHISWSNSGLELVVVDVVGNLSIYTMFVAVNSYSLAGSFQWEQGEALGPIIGLEWLSINRVSSIYYTANRADDTWSYLVSHSKPSGPYHPLPSKSALLCLTRSAVLRLVFADLDNSWQETNTEVAKIETSEKLLTHASFGHEEEGSGSMLVATCDFACTLRLYRVSVDWNFPYSARQPPPVGYRLGPTLDVALLKEVSHFGLKIYDQPATTQTQLCHLKMVPPTLDPTDGQNMPATIMAVFTVMENAPSLPFSSRVHSSRVAWWEIDNENEQLHATFDHLASKKKDRGSPSDLPSIIKLRRIGDIDLPGVVISITPLRINTIFAFSQADGVIDFRDRFSMQPITTNPSFYNLCNILHAGFSFPPDDACLHLAFSPSHCVAVVKGNNDELRLRYMEHFTAVEDEPSPETIESAAASGLCLTFATTCAQHYFNDDVLAIMQRSLNKVSVERLLDGVITSTATIVDYSTENNYERLLRSPVFLRIMSVQHMLGNVEKRPNLSSRMAWCILNLRISALTLHLALGGIPDDSPGDLPASVIGIVKWYFDMMSFILDEVFTISRKVRGHEGDQTLVQQQIIQANTPALSLLLSSIPRVLLSYSLRCLRPLISTARRLSHHPTNPHRKSWTALLSLVSAGAIDPIRFETFVAEIEHHVKATYERAGCTAAQRTAVEKKLLTTGKVSEVLMPVVQRLLTGTLDKLAEDVDSKRLFFMDVRWLGLTDDARTRAWHKAHTVDVLRKVELRMPGTTHGGTSGVAARVRRCTRCCAYMEDLVLKGLCIWVLSTQKSCICGNPWVYVDA